MAELRGGRRLHSKAGGRDTAGLWEGRGLLKVGQWLCPFIPHPRWVQGPGDMLALV